ncbi:MAG TPA: branched-chain amino acid transaminase [Gemmatimonadaceae bacterium]|nr:branched-chain amino acid transaminase [Gemmatimonadaceae bacterium]
MKDRASGRTAKIWRDGALVDWNDANIHVMSHVAHYGSSVFEGIRCYETPGGTAVFRLHEHMNRLMDSCRIYRMPMEYTAEELVQATVETVAANDVRQCYIRPIVIRTGEQMGFYPIGVPVEVFIICWKWDNYLGHDAYENGADACVSSWRRAAPDTYPTLAKASGNYLNSQLSKIEARQDGYHEAISLDVFGFVSEGTGENLFLVKGGVLFTAPIAAGILQGITRDTVMRLARDLGHEVREQTIPREMLYLADEVFFCGTAVEITPVRSIDRIPVGSGKPGPITKALQNEFLGIAKGRLPDRHGWLTAVPVPAATASG